MSVHLRPEEIETESFRIIDDEAGPHGWPADAWQVVRRMIHTSADFDYSRTVTLSADAISAGIAALRQGRGIVTDTAMALAGINKGKLAAFGCPAACFVADPEVARRAAAEGVTRSIVAMRVATVVFPLPGAPTITILRDATRLSSGRRMKEA